MPVWGILKKHQKISTAAAWAFTPHPLSVIFFVFYSSMFILYKAASTSFIAITLKQFKLKDFLLDLRNDLSKLNLKPDKSNVNQDVINLTLCLTQFLIDMHQCVQCQEKRKD